MKLVKLSCPKLNKGMVIQKKKTQTITVMMILMKMMKIVMVMIVMSRRLMLRDDRERISRNSSKRR